MPPSEAQKEASRKWNKEKVESLHIRVKKGMRDVIQAHADEVGESVNAFVVRAVVETIERDKNSGN